MHKPRSGFGRMFPSSGELAPLEGNSSIILQSGSHDSDSSTLIRQVGDIPKDARSIRFLANADVSASRSFSNLQLSADGQRLSIVELSERDANGTLTLGADVSSIAGQSVEIQFESLFRLSDRIESNVYIDAIEYSPIPIPEPSSAALTALGLLGLGCPRAIGLRHCASSATR